MASEYAYQFRDSRSSANVSITVMNIQGRSKKIYNVSARGPDAWNQRTAP